MKKKDNSYWSKKLDRFSYKILREAGTEMPFSGEYNMHFEDGLYKCKGCGNVLFESNSKFDSGCGWPSFDKAVEGSIVYKEDNHNAAYECIKEINKKLKSLRKLDLDICSHMIGNIEGSNFDYNKNSYNFDHKKYDYYHKKDKLKSDHIKYKFDFDIKIIKDLKKL